jgi:hypothetical protein
MTSFEDGVRAGLEKVAASVEELQAAYNRAGIVRLTRGGMRAMDEEGPFSVPKASQGKANLRQEARAWRDFPSVSDPLKEQASNLVDKSNVDGKAFMTRRGAGHSQGGRYSPRTAEGWRANNIRSGLHEVGERRIKPHQVVSEYDDDFGHHSPKVIFDEFNLVKKMTGPGSDEARRVQLRMRAGGEMKDIKGVINKAYGAKGWDYVKQHGFTKSMKKDLLKRFQSRVSEDPERITSSVASSFKDAEKVVMQAYGKRGWDHVQQHGFSKAMRKNLLNRFNYKAPEKFLNKIETMKKFSPSTLARFGL